MNDNPIQKLHKHISQNVLHKCTHWCMRAHHTHHIGPQCTHAHVCIITSHSGNTAVYGRSECSDGLQTHAHRPIACSRVHPAYSTFTSGPACGHCTLTQFIRRPSVTAMYGNRTQRLGCICTPYPQRVHPPRAPKHTNASLHAGTAQALTHIHTLTLTLTTPRRPCGVWRWQPEACCIGTPTCRH